MFIIAGVPRHLNKKQRMPKPGLFKEKAHNAFGFWKPENIF